MTRIKGRTVYKNKAGKVLPGTTTIVGLLAKPQLIAWANKLGQNGIDSSRFVDDLAGVGHLAHEMVFAHLTGKKVNTDDYSKNDIKRAENAMLSFREWLKDKTIEVVLAETPIVSEAHQFGGTPDLLAKVNGELWLIDFKTSKAIYEEMIYQLAAYRLILKELGHDIEKVMIVRIGREASEGFETRTYTNFDNAEAIFLDLLDIYKRRKT
jgi:predicted RecB family nuclease